MIMEMTPLTAAMGTDGWSSLKKSALKNTCNVTANTSQDSYLDINVNDIKLTTQVLNIISVSSL